MSKSFCKAVRLESRRDKWEQKRKNDGQNIKKKNPKYSQSAKYRGVKGGDVISGISSHQTKLQIVDKYVDYI